MSIIIDSYSETNRSQNATFSAVTTRLGQSFIADGTTLDSATLMLSKIGLPTGNLDYSIYAHAGTYGSSGIPTGTPLATSNTIDVATLTTTPTLVSLGFTGINKIVLASSTNYFLVATHVGADASNAPYIGIDDTSPTHGGNVASWNTPTWSAISTWDFPFYVYSVSPPPALTGISTLTGVSSITL